MPKKATQKPAEAVSESAPVETQPNQKGKSKKATTPSQPPAKPEQPVKAEVAATKPSSKKVPAKKASVKSPPLVEETHDEETVAETEVAPKSTRQVPTRESVEREFDELLAVIDQEIEKLRGSAAKSKGVKFLRTVSKKARVLKGHALRVSKQRATTRRNNTNSGFLKPVQISKELAKFTGWNPSELKSRVDVTKSICEYIKKNNLQKPEDKRRILVSRDQNLKKLLKYDQDELTYFDLQKCLKGHFLPTPVDVKVKA